jgi:hypothetical protein
MQCFYYITLAAPEIAIAKFNVIADAVNSPRPFFVRSLGFFDLRFLFLERLKTFAHTFEYALDMFCAADSAYRTFPSMDSPTEAMTIRRKVTN